MTSTDELRIKFQARKEHRKRLERISRRKILGYITLKNKQKHDQLTLIEQRNQLKQEQFLMQKRNKRLSEWSQPVYDWVKEVPEYILIMPLDDKLKLW